MVNQTASPKKQEQNQIQPGQKDQVTNLGADSQKGDPTVKTQDGIKGQGKPDTLPSFSPTNDKKPQELPRKPTT